MTQQARQEPSTRGSQLSVKDVRSLHMPSIDSANGFLADELERLIALPLATAADVGVWNQQCGSVRQELKQRFPDFEPEHELWHFFSDADIRARDSSYRECQHRSISGYIQRLRHANVT